MSIFFVFTSFINCLPMGKIKIINTTTQLHQETDPHILKEPTREAEPLPLVDQ